MQAGRQGRNHLGEAAISLMLFLEDDDGRRVARLRMAGTALFGLLLAGAPPSRALLVVAFLFVLAVLGFAWEVLNAGATMLAVAGLLTWCLGLDPVSLLLR